MKEQIKQLVEELSAASDAYYNTDEVLMTDAEYDQKEFELRKLDPLNEFLIQVGSDIRGGKINLPFAMGSLDQIYEGDFEKWITDKNLHNELFIITAKMDGTSVQIVYGDNGELKICYSRGDGLQGADITRHIKQIKSVPKNLSEPNTIAVRGECIMSESNFVKFQKECESKKYKTYKNPRNAMAGLMNSETLPEWIYKYLDVIVYDIFDSQSNKEETLQFLADNDFKVVIRKSLFGDQISDELMSSIINENIAGSDYEQDGIVIELNDTYTRMLAESERTRETLNPAYARKFKILMEDNIAESDVTSVEWALSKHGVLKPRIAIEPVDLKGVTITFTAGFNARYIVDNVIGPAASVKITRSGDVIPYILDVLKPAEEPDLPSVHEFGEYDWNENEVEFILKDAHENYDVRLKRVVSFFSSIEIPLLKEGTIKKFFENGFDDIPKIINMTKEEMIEIAGVNGGKINDGMAKILNGILEYKFAGSLHLFGSGIGARKLKKVYEKHHKIRNLSIEQLIEADGFDLKSAEKVMSGMVDYQELLAEIKPDKLIFGNPETQKESSSDELVGTVWVLTGFRDKELQEKIEDAGGTIGGGVNGKTTHLVAKDLNSTFDKMKKARELGVTILGIDEAKSQIG